MNVTTFDRRQWNLETFQDVGYEKETRRLCIYLLDNTVLEFKPIDEAIVFQFVIARNKETFIEEILMTHYPFHILYQGPTIRNIN